MNNRFNWKYRLITMAVVLLILQLFSGERAIGQGVDDKPEPVALFQLSSNVMANIDQVCAVRKEKEDGQVYLRVHFRSRASIKISEASMSNVWNHLLILADGPGKTGWRRIGETLLINLDCVENIQHREGSLSFWCVDGTAEIIRDDKEAEPAWNTLLAKNGNFVLLTPSLLVNLNNVDYITSDETSLRIRGPSGTWPTLKVPSERQAAFEKLQALRAPATNNYNSQSNGN